MDSILGESNTINEKQIGFLDIHHIIIGSSNITQRALKNNVEWNVRIISKKDDSFVKEILEEYLKLWEDTSIVNEEFLDSYKSFINELKQV